MRVTEDELIGIWRYFQYCCLPSIIMARYAFLDYIGDIRADRQFCRHGRKYAINRIGKYLEMLPNKLMDINYGNVKYMNILGDNVEELFEEEEKELHRSIYITFRNAKMKHLDCLSALHYIHVMLQIASATFYRCCSDMIAIWHKDPTKTFGSYDLHGITRSWGKIVDEATVFYGYDKVGKKQLYADLNNIRCTKVVGAIRSKLSDIETLRIAMRKSYPWSPNYEEGVPYEQSVDYLIVNNKS